MRVYEFFRLADCIFLYFWFVKTSFKSLMIKYEYILSDEKVLSAHRINLM